MLATHHAGAAEVGVIVGAKNQCEKEKKKNHFKTVDVNSSLSRNS